MLAPGLFSGLFGAIFAAFQTDMKRLHAYSSIESMGLIFAGISLSILFAAGHMPLFAALALTALVHALKHAPFKSLLFLATGRFFMRHNSAACRTDCRGSDPDRI